MAKKRHRHALEPGHGVYARQAFGREVEQAESALRGGAHHGALFLGRLRAVEKRGGNAHIGKLRHLVLHQRDERGDHDHGAVPSASAGNW